MNPSYPFVIETPHSKNFEQTVPVSFVKGFSKVKFQNNSWDLPFITALYKLHHIYRVFSHSSPFSLIQIYKVGDLFLQSVFLQLTSHYSFAGKLAGKHPWRQQQHHVSLAATLGRIGLPFPSRQSRRTRESSFASLKSYS